MFKKLINLFSGKVNQQWSLVEPKKRGGSYAIYFEDKHVASVRGKTKALVLIHIIKGTDITNKLYMSK